MTLRYQKAGIYPWAHPDIVPAITEISRAVGLPGIAMSCYQPGGVGAHRTGHACDFQAGWATDDRYDSWEAHQRLAKYILQNWDRLRVRYTAWDGVEYGGAWGGPERRRPQVWEPWHKTASDPWHKSHVHVDFVPGPIPGANPQIEVGAGLPTLPTPGKPAPTIDLQEETMKLIQTPDGMVWATNGIEKRHVATPAILDELRKVFGEKVQAVTAATGDSIPTRLDLRALPGEVQKVKAEVGRSAGRERDLIETSRVLLDATGLIVGEVHDPESKRTLRTRMEQTNAAVGRAERARLQAEKEAEKETQS